MLKYTRGLKKNLNLLSPCCMCSWVCQDRGETKKRRRGKTKTGAAYQRTAAKEQWERERERERERGVPIWICLVHCQNKKSSWRIFLVFRWRQYRNWKNNHQGGQLCQDCWAVDLPHYIKSAFHPHFSFVFVIHGYKILYVNWA